MKTKEQREERFRKILENATSGKIKNCGNITSWKFSMEEEDIKKFLDFIESEVEKAKKEGKNELVKEIGKAIKEDMKITDTEDKHFEIDKDIVKILNDKEITKMFTHDNEDIDLYDGGWGWYS